MNASDRYLVDGISCRLDDGEAMPVSNLSVGGLFAATVRPPMLGQVVALRLSLPRREPFPLVGRVTWINDPSSPRAPDLPQGFGIKITEIAFPDKLAILDLLKRSRTRTARRVSRSGPA